MKYPAKLRYAEGVILIVLFRSVLLLCLAAALPYTAFAAPADSPERTAANAQISASSQAQSTGSQGLDMGSVTDNVYTNNFFGFTYEFPKGWSVPSEETRKYMKELRKAAATGGDPTKSALFDVAEKRTHQLLTVLEHPVGTPGATDASIYVMAEDISYAPGVQKPSDYLLNTKAGLVKQRPDVKVLREPTDTTYGGKPFSRMETSVEKSPGQTLYTGYAAAILNSQAILFLFACNKPEQLASLMDTLNTLQFKPELIATSALVNPQMFSIPQVFMLNSTGKANLQPYLFQLMNAVKTKWYGIIPKEAIEGAKGKVFVNFGIKRDGTFSANPRVEQGSGKNTLDDATVTAVKMAAPFDPLPPDFKDKEIRLRMVFFYNIPSESVLK
jgi:TonB family protein